MVGMVDDEEKLVMVEVEVDDQVGVEGVEVGIDEIGEEGIVDVGADGKYASLEQIETYCFHCMDQNSWMAQVVDVVVTTEFDNCIDLQVRACF